MTEYLKKAHHFYYRLVIGLVYLFIFPFVYLYSRKPINLNGLNRMRRILSQVTSSLSGFFFSYDFEKPIDWSRTYIICANHTSNLDISTVILLVKRRFVFLGKEELLDNLVTRIYFKTIDIPINRASKISSYRGFKRAEQYLKNGTHVIIFPEGLIGNDYPPVLHPFKLGPFRLAIEHNIPILPVTITDNWKLLWDDGARFGSKPGNSQVFVHEPLETAAMNITEAEELRDHVFSLISKKLHGTVAEKAKPVIAADSEVLPDLNPLP